MIKLFYQNQVAMPLSTSLPQSPRMETPSHRLQAAAEAQVWPLKCSEDRDVDNWSMKLLWNDEAKMHFSSQSNLLQILTASLLTALEIYSLALFFIP